MADVELVIKIPKSYYRGIKEIHLCPMFGFDNWKLIAQAIENGTPLPKGHGDLIEKQGEQIEIQEKIIENYKKMVDTYEQKVEILEELLRREGSKNETLAQGSDQLSSATAADSTMEGVLSDSRTSSEGSHT